jgi:hypothetical protein
MMDFFFFLKTFLLTAIVVLLLQIEVGKKTVETHVHDFVQGSLAAGFLGHAAHGGAHMVHDSAVQMTQKIKEHMGLKHKNESPEAKASRFHWGWQGSKPKESDQIDSDPN